ncbi:MAG TPA: cyclic nucleotide-binding domain-containing protein [bacterium]|nr:cyclic nucleotide-binding domain-containing protein [bacterium]
MAAKKEKPADFLREVSLFDGVEDKILGHIFHLGKVKHYSKGESIIREGEAGGNLHIIIEGSAEVSLKKDKQDRSRYLADLERGSIFGEMSVFDAAPYSATVKAREECSVHVIKGEDFKKFLKQNPQEGYVIFTALVKQLSSRLRRTNLAFSLLGFDS